MRLGALLLLALISTIAVGCDAVAKEASGTTMATTNTTNDYDNDTATTANTAATTDATTGIVCTVAMPLTTKGMVCTVAMPLTLAGPYFLGCTTDTTTTPLPPAAPSCLHCCDCSCNLWFYSKNISPTYIISFPWPGPRPFYNCLLPYLFGWPTPHFVHKEGQHMARSSGPQVGPKQEQGTPLPV